ncbi:Uma2 family endonuclease [Thermomicrobium sp. CFH 73360]|nr:Uma2 family endonuclease [Thermomicrobium sp. CFH 73360]
MAELYVRHVGRLAIVRTEGPIRLSEYVLTCPYSASLRAHSASDTNAEPGPANVLPIIAVGDTSSADDRYTNLQLWGHAGIPEAWLVDITAQRVVLFRAPHAEECQDQDQMGSGNVVSPGAFLDLSPHHQHAGPITGSLNGDSGNALFHTRFRPI